MFDPVEKLKEFIRHPSVSTDPKFHEGMKGAQEFVASLLTSLGFSVDVVKTELHPIIFAQRGGDKSWPHLVIYGHYDVQPADPLNLWKTPAFEPTIVGNRIYGRGAADNKGPLLTNIAAVARALEDDPKLPRSGRGRHRQTSMQRGRQGGLGCFLVVPWSLPPSLSSSLLSLLFPLVPFSPCCSPVAMTGYPV